jgi:cell division protein ZapA
LLEERIRSYQKNLRIQDQQDLLAMVAFDCLVESLKIQSKGSTQINKLMQNIEGWRNCIEKVLDKET